ncbi:hypothetical protein TURU_004562 [Turdus rufiventris]|nr:hypothetical protein TURU_004562 [Turdus rufiventris]
MVLPYQSMPAQAPPLFVQTPEALLTLGQASVIRQPPPPPPPIGHKQTTPATGETEFPPGSRTWHKTRKINNGDSKEEEDKHKLLPLREVPTALGVIGFMNIPINTGDVRAFKKEMDSLMDDSIGVADMLDEFLGTSAYMYDDINTILRLLFNIKEEK